MNKLAMVCLVVLGGGVVVVPIAARTRRDDAIRANVYVGNVALGGLAPEAAQLTLRQWWEDARRKKLVLRAEGSKAALPQLTPTMLGVGLDDKATVAQLPLEGILPGGEAMKTTFQPIFVKVGDPDPSLAQALAKSGSIHEARAVWRKGTVVRTKEGSSQTLDASSVADKTIEILEKGKNTVTVDLKEAPKHVADEDLKKITHVISTFSTRFSAGNRPRSSNIKLASSFFNGQVLMPGDRISYNGTVGRRTLQRGFKVAGVYIDGKHDTGVGGGICQVSTTLYNAALFADMKILQRRNHSLPVPYVPLGRDATVDWGNIDLAFENTSDAPVALESAYTPGRLTFRFLGPKPDADRKIEIEGTGVRISPGRTVTKRDSSIPSGVRRVESGGGNARSVSTYRIVKDGGKVVRRDSLGTSYYNGSPRIIIVGTGARPKPVAPPVAPPPAATASSSAPTGSIPPTEPAQTAPLPR
ncbi:VanW family protein [soil metagenome]